MSQRRVRAAWVAKVACLALGVSGGVGPGRSTASPPARPAVTVTRDIAYRDGPSKSWRLDLAVPKEKATKPRPAVVVIHGGGWVEGDKSSFASKEHGVPGNIEEFAELGFVAATINYRLSGEAPYPAALDDCRCAIRWLRAHAREYDVDPERIGAYGNSAGGHLALLLGMAKDARPDADAPHGKESSQVQAVVSDSGPIDLLHQYQNKRLHQVVEKFLGGPPTGDRADLYKQASPASHVGPKAPPLLLIYGGADEQVPVETADEFVAALGRAGLKDVTYHRLAYVDHCPHSLVRLPRMREAVNEFFLRTLMHPETAQQTIRRPDGK